MTKYFFCDTETTGVDHQRHGIIQLAGIIAYEEGGEFVEKETFDLKCQPFEKDVVEDAALAVNGITRETLATYKPASEAYYGLLNTLKKYVDKFDKQDKFLFVGYNSRFDSDFVRAMFNKMGDKYYGSWFAFPSLDVMNMAAVHFRNERSTFPDFKLGTVAARMNIAVEGEGLHDALTDIRVAMKMFRFLTQSPIKKE